MKKIITIILVIVMTCTTLCISALAEDNRPTGTLKMLMSSGGAAESLIKGIEAYMAETGNVIEYISYSTSELREKQILNLRSVDNQQDIIMLDGGVWLAEQNAYLEPLDEYIAQSGIDTDRFVDSFYNMFSLNGQQFALPFRIGGWVLLYRKDLFEAAGLTETPKNMDELREYAKILTKDGVYGFEAAMKQGTFLVSQYAPFLYSYGGSFLNEDNTAAALNSEAGIKALQLLVDMLNTDGSIPDSALDNEHQGLYTALQQGLGAMAITYSPYYLNVNDPNASTVAGEFDVAPFLPTGSDSLDAGVSHFSGWGIAINKNSDRKDLAWDFIEFMTRPDVQTMLAVDSVNAPVTKATFLDEKYLDVFPAAPQVLDAVNTGKSFPAISNWAKIEDIIALELSNALTLQKTPEQALADAETAINKELR